MLLYKEVFDMAVSHEIKNYSVTIGRDCAGVSTRAEIILNGDEDNKAIGSIVFWDSDEHLPPDSMTNELVMTMNLNVSMLHDVIDLLEHSVHIDFIEGYRNLLDRRTLREGTIHPIGAYMKPPSL